MRIVILTDRIAPLLGGAIGVAYQQARGLAARGHAVTVVASAGAVPPQAGLTVRTVSAAFHPRYAAYLGLHNPAAVRQVEKIFEEIRPDVVHAHNLYHALSYRCLVAARRATPRVFLTAHDVMSFAYAKLTHFINPDDVACPTRPNYHTPWPVNLSHARKQYNPFRNVIIRNRLARITKVFAVSQALADALADNGIRNVVVVRNGIDVQDWQTPAAEALQDFRKRYQLENRKVLLFSGRLSGAKGISQVLMALAQVVRREPSALLLIAGDVEDGRGYEALPKKFGVESNVVFAGRLDAAAMALAYDAGDVVVVPSVCFDSFPSVNLEAMAAGKPVVATCFGGSREAVTDGETGFIVNPYDSAAFSDRILRLLSDPALARRFGQAGRQRVAQEFSSPRWLGELEAWYRR